ncbi:MAG: hypothetical protein ABMB14_17085 [Myxococcota bacterium]
MGKIRTRLETLNGSPRPSRFSELEPKDLRRAVGGLRPPVSTADVTLNSDCITD